MKPKPLLTLPAAAARLGISTNAARQAAQEGRLAARPVVDSEGAVVALAVEMADLAAFVPAVRGRRPKGEAVIMETDNPQATPCAIRDLRSKIRSAQKRQRRYENDRCKPRGSPEHHEVLAAVRAAWDEYDREVVRRAMEREVKP